MSHPFKGRREDQRLLTGQGRFTADWTLPAQAHAAFVRADRAHARILAVDTAAARAAPAVIAVLTGSDFAATGWRSPPPLDPGPGVGGMRLADPHRPALAHGRVRFTGEPVALVVAESEEAALEAAELIAVAYEDLPVLVSAAEAAAPGAVLVHEAVPGNLALAFEYGDRAATEAALAKAAHVVRLELSAQRIFGSPMEPKACLAAHHAATDSYDVFTQTQGMADIQSALAHVTGLPRDRFRIHAEDVGGAFGVRNEAYPEIIALMLAARATGRPVRWVGSRAETIVSDHHARAADLEAELALGAGGEFLGLRVEWLVNLGAYCTNAGPFINTTAAPRTMATNAYRVPAIHGRHRLMLTNTTPVAPYRGAGRPNVSYLWERLVDEAARVTGIDRIELRRRNLIPREAFPYKTPTGSTYDSADPPGLIEAALDAADWSGFPARRAEAAGRGRLRGIGLALFIEPSGGVAQEEIAIEFGADGRPWLYTLAGPSGQGYETVYPEIVARVLGIDAGTIALRSSDPSGPTLSSGTGSFGSRSLLSHGTALHKGALEVVERGKALAADHLEVSSSDIVFEAGRYVVKGTDLSVGFAELVSRHARAGEPHPLDTRLKVAVSGAFPSGAHVAEVEIDGELGSLEIVRYVAVDDGGVIYNHKIVEGQLLGGLMQGIGQATCERAVYDATGQLLSGSFMDYAMPHADMLPAVTLIDRPVPSPANPLGAKGVGEAGATGAVPTIANAVHDALAAAGVTRIEMPYTPERIWQALQGRSI